MFDTEIEKMLNKAQLSDRKPIVSTTEFNRFKTHGFRVGFQLGRRAEYFESDLTFEDVVSEYEVDGDNVKMYYVNSTEVFKTVCKIKIQELQKAIDDSVGEGEKKNI